MSSAPLRLVLFAATAVVWAFPAMVAATPVISTDQGLPGVTSYTAEALGAAFPANALIEGPDGLIYVAHHERVLRFTGSHWQELQPSGESAIYLDLAFDGPDRIYFGGLSRFGFLERQPEGNFELRDLTAELPDEGRGLHFFRNLHVTEEGIYVQSYQEVSFLGRDGARQIWRFASFLGGIFRLDGRIYAYGEDPYLGRLESDGSVTPIEIPWEPEVGEGFVVRAAPFGPLGDRERSVIFIAISAGAFHFDGETVTRLAGDPWALAVENPNVNHLAGIEGGFLAIATTGRGLALYDGENRFIHRLHSENGLIGDEALDLAYDSQGGLWYTTRRGLSRIQYPAAASYLSRRQGIIGTVSSVLRYDGDLFVGTDAGLWRQSGGRQGEQTFFEVMSGSAVRSLWETAAGLLVGCSNGVQLYRNGQIEGIAALDGGYLYQFPDDPDRVFAGGASGLYSLQRTVTGWEAGPLYPEIKQPLHGLAGDEAGNLWAVTGIGSVLRITPTGDRISAQAYGPEAGLDPNAWITPLILGKDVFIPAQGRVLRYDKGTDTFLEAPGYSYFPGEPPYLFPQVLGGPDGTVFVTVNPQRPLLRPRSDDGLALALQLFGETSDPRTVDAHRDADGVTFYALHGGIVRLDPSVPPPPELALQTLLLGVKSLRSEALLLCCLGQQEPILRLPHRENSLRFNFSLPHYVQPSRNEFTHILEGFDDGWSLYGTTPSREYTNLPPGTYRFQVVGRDPMRREYPVAQVTVIIDAPLHQTAAAYLLYALTLLLFLYGIFRWRMAALNAQNRDLNAEVASRTRELSAQTELLQKRNFELRRAVETEAQLRVQAETATRTKSRFLANMSHELRTPMNGVLGMCAILRETDLTVEQADYVQTIHRSSEALLRILNDILDLSMVESGRITLQPEPFNLIILLEEIAELLGPLASEKGLDFSLHLAPSLCPFRFGDAARLRQILTNLLSNAIKFTPTGRIHLHVRPGDGPDSTLFEVADTGIGISPENQEAIFEEFRQIESSTTRRFEGTGLGLTITRRLVQLMDGNLQLRENHPSGSVFTLVLDLPPGPRPHELPPPVDLKGARIAVRGSPGPHLTYLTELLSWWGADLLTVPAACPLHPEIRSGLRALILLDHSPEDLTTFAAPGWEGLLRLQILPPTRIYEPNPAPALPDFQILRLPIRRSQLGDCFRAASHVKPPPAAPVTPSTPPQEATEALPVQLAELRLLLAEDNKVNQKVAALLLRRWGLNPVLAQDGAEVIALHEANPFDIILMDNHMPKIDGCEATRRIRAMGDAIHQPFIIAVTASVTQEDRDHFTAAGMDAFVAKPIRREALAEALAQFLPGLFD